MTLPTLRMESANFVGSTLTLSTGAVTVTNGRGTVPFQGVTEALAKGFTISDPSVRWPPAKTAMCPPSTLSPVVYASAPNAPLLPALNPAYKEYTAYPNNTETMLPSSAGGPQSAPALAAVDTRMSPAYRPRPDPTPYANLTLPDSTVLQVPYPGNNMVEIPAQHVAYYKSQGWTLLSEYL